MEFLKDGLVLAGSEELVSKKSGEKYMIVRVMEMGSGRQLEFMVFDDTMIKNILATKPFTPVKITIKLDQDSRGVRAFLKEFKKAA